MIAVALMEPEMAPVTPREERYLQPGEVHASGHRTRVTTILGSCVAVCLFDPRRHVAGLNHFLLPCAPTTSATSTRYGDVAIEVLVRRLLTLGASRETLRAKIFGGANVLHAFSDGERHIGTANVEIARELLDRCGIPLVAEDVGGTRGRKLVFSIPDGLTWVEAIGQ
jgi:chemotaxis protein CheD